MTETLAPTIYHFDASSGLLLDTGLARQSPAEPGVYTHPAFSTLVTPPDVPPGQLAVFSLTLGEWALVDVPAAPQPAEAPAVEPVPMTHEERLKHLQALVQGKLDDQARLLGYDDIRTAVTYAEEDSDPVFQAEGRALRAWRSLTWRKCYDVLAEVEAGEAEEPTWPELENMLPAYPGVPAPEVSE
jgi:hypothetical protein